MLGPIQIGYGRSTEPVEEQEMAVGRIIQQAPGKEGTGTFGRRYYLPFVTIRQEGTYSGALGPKNGVTTERLTHFWEALVDGINQRRSTMRGERHLRRLTVLCYPDAFGHGQPVKFETEFKTGWELADESTSTAA